MGSTSGDDDQSGRSKLNNTTLTWNNNNEKLKSGMKSWREYPYGCSWPPKHYKCNFCKREFKSAQALGGHMNVHRRDRARLKSNPSSPPPPPWINTNYVSNPPSNPNNPSNPSGLTPSSSSSSLPTTSIYTHQYSLVSLSLSSSFLPNRANIILGRGRGRKFHDYSSSNFKACSSSKDEDEKGRGVKLDLELRLIRDTKEDDQDLDLELRLGTYKKQS